MAGRPRSQGLEARAAKTGRSRRPRHALGAWPEIEKRLNSGGWRALFLDFDGTLARIRARPEQVRCSGRVRSVLSRLAHRPDLWIGVVSGRRSHTLARLIRVNGIEYLGAYGAETPGSRLKISSAARGGLTRVRRGLARRLGRDSGVWMENKGVSFAVHYRGARQHAGTSAEDALRREVAPERARLRLIAGRKSWEVVPREIPGKGAAVRAVMQRLPARSMGIYIGDSAPDEKGFGALPGGITIRVGRSGRSLARYFLRTPGEVLQWLVRFEEALP